MSNDESIICNFEVQIPSSLHQITKECCIWPNYYYDYYYYDYYDYLKITLLANKICAKYFNLKNKFCFVFKVSMYHFYGRDVPCMARVSRVDKSDLERDGPHNLIRRRRRFPHSVQANSCIMTQNLPRLSPSHSVSHNHRHI
jgi:hypothetical protein